MNKILEELKKTRKEMEALHTPTSESKYGDIETLDGDSIHQGWVEALDYVINLIEKQQQLTTNKETT